MVIKPSCNYYFWCLQELEKKFGVLYKKFLKNLGSKKFFFVKMKLKILKNSIFAKSFYQTVFFNTKYQFEMVSAFI